MVLKGCSPRELIVGEKIGMLTILKFCYFLKRRSYWNCKCECGNEIIISRRKLLETKNPDCGCVPRINKGPYAKRDSQESIEYKINCIKNKSHWEGKCLIWEGHLQGGTTPRMSYMGISITVRKWLWEYHTGKSSTKPKKVICGDKRCINIEHITE